MSRVTINDPLLSTFMGRLVRLTNSDESSEQRARMRRLARIIGRALNVAPDDILEEAYAMACEGDDGRD